MHHRFRNLGLMAALAIASAIPIAANAAPLPDTVPVGQYANYAIDKTDQTAARPAPDIVAFGGEASVSATAYAESLQTKTIDIVANDPQTGGSIAYNESYVISVRDTSTSAVVGTSSSPTPDNGLVANFDSTLTYGGSGLAYNSTPAVGSVCSYVGTPTYAQTFATTNVDNHYVLHT